MFATALRLARNDLRLFFRDRTGLLLGFALPIALVGIFGFIMGAMGSHNASQGMSAVSVPVRDEDVSPASAAFVQALRDGTMVHPELPDAGQPAPTRDELRQRVDEGDESFALVIPKGFSDGADLVLLRDPGRELEGRLVQIGLMSALFKARGPDVAWDLTRRSLHAAGIPPEWDARIQTLFAPFRAGMQALFVDAARQSAAPIASTSEAVDPMRFMEHALPVEMQDVVPAGRDKQIGYYVSQAVSGMTVMMLLFTLTGAARSLISERDRGTLRRLLAAPLDSKAILLGKFLSGWALGMILIVVLYTFAWLVFKVDVLSRWGTLLVISTATAAACTAFGVAVAAWARTDKQADGVSTLIILSMSALGGAWFPTMMMPAAAQTVAKFTLTYWSLRGYQASLWSGQTWHDATVLMPVGVVLAIAVGLTTLAIVLFRRRYLAG